MKRKVIITIILLLIFVCYNNSSWHIKKHVWKYNGDNFSEDYEDILIFNSNNVYHYEWPTIYKYDEKIGNILFCIGDRMWITYLCDSSETRFIEYVGK